MKHNIKTLLATLLLTVACQTNPTITNSYKSNDEVFQLSLLQSLMQGEYDGVMSVQDIKNYGDFGIGTFDSINGELTALDGKIYQALSDGSVIESPENETIPFATMKFFIADKINSQAIQADSINHLKQQLNSIIQSQKNMFYFARINGTFKSINVRSELKQQPP